MVMFIRTKDGYTYRFKAKSDLKTIYWVQQRHGKWPEWKTIDIEDFDEYTGFSIVQFELKPGVQVFGIVKGQSVIAQAKIDLMPYVVNRMILNALAFQGKLLSSPESCTTMDILVKYLHLLLIVLHIKSMTRVNRISLLLRSTKIAHKKCLMEIIHPSRHFQIFKSNWSMTWIKVKCK